MIIRDQANQKQDVSTLSRDTDHANGSIDPIFNKEKEQKRLQTAQMIGEIGNQVADIARTNGKIAATEAANEKMKTAGSDARNAAISQLKKDGKEVTDQAIHDQMYQTFYNEAFNQSGMGTGQSTQRAITAATAGIQALAGGDIKAAIAGGAAPYIANAIANAIPEKDLKGRVLAHAVVNAALAAASGRDAASAAAGAAVGELAGKIAVDGFGKQVSELSEEEKQTVSALATLASGLAGGLVGDSSANAVAAAQAGKTTVENNTLGIAPPVPAPVLGVPVSPGDQVTKNANDKIALAVDDLFDAVDKATQCSFGRACSSDDSDQGLKPNVAGNMTDDEKAEYGGAGSGTPGGWGPEDEEKARAQQAQIEAKKQVESLGYDSNKVSHIFADKHQMDKLVSEFGSPEAALERMHEAVQPLAKNPGSYQTGSCWVTVRVGGNDVAVKGIVINGEFRISTATMRPF
ncbi:VENN motif pre-toxin domain-containing protein [Enterobacter quasiroggenkampii]|nr:VENN motif pre-toxin domain-containing protein [Enterobacter quasiroggenkampii]